MKLYLVGPDPVVRDSCGVMEWQPPYSIVAAEGPAQAKALCHMPMYQTWKAVEIHLDKPVWLEHISECAVLGEDE